MFLTADQITAFFEDASQMVFSNRIHFDSLNAEGMTSVDDLDGWDDDDWDQWMINCKKPYRIPDPINYAKLILQVPLLLLFKSLKRLKIDYRMVCYYDSVSVNVTTTNLRWMVLDNFKIKCKSVAKQSKK